MKNNNYKLYNVFFPIWLLLLFPPAWLIVLPINLLIDSLVIYFTLKYLKVEEKINILKKAILKTWIFGFVADIIGVIVMLLPIFVEFNYNSNLYNFWHDNVVAGLSMNPFLNPYSFIYALACLVLSSYLIYVFNIKYVFKKLDLEDGIKHKLSLSLAIFTAPILFMIPTAFFSGGYYY